MAEQHRAALERIRSAIAAIDRHRLEPGEAQRQLEIQQRCVVHLAVAAGKIECHGPDDELLAWERLARKYQQPTTPGVPRVDDVSVARVPLVGTGRSLHISPPEGIWAWIAHAIAVVDALKADIRGDDTTPDGDVPDKKPPALTRNDTQVIATMAGVDGSRLLSAVMIAEEMDRAERLSDRTIRPIVRRLIELGLAERPEGKNSGARLTMEGRRIAAKIAD